MPILQDFCQAFEQAIRQYETEWNGSISTDRQNQIASFRAYLAQCQNPNLPSTY